MAERNVHAIRGDFSIQFGDGTRTYDFKWDGTVSIQAGGYTPVRAVNAAGTFVGVARNGGQAGPTTISISAKQFGAPGHASDVTLTDFAFLSGLFSSTWTTTDGSDTGMKAFNVVITQAATHSTAGATYTINDCIVRPGSKMAPALDGVMIDLELESAAAYPTIATVAP